MLPLSSAARKPASGLGSACAGAAKPIAAARRASTTSVRMASSSYRLTPLSRPRDKTGRTSEPKNEAVEAPYPLRHKPGHFPRHPQHSQPAAEQQAALTG